MIDGILGVLGSLIYPLFSVVFSLMDLFQVIFGAFAGVNTITYDGTPITSGNTGLETDTGIVYYLLTSDVVANMFWSMVILAIVLLLIFTTMTFLRNIYSAQPKNWKVIVGNAIKGLANFIIVPVLSLLGVWLGNIVLQAVNGATATGDAITLSRQLFITSAYNANRTRIEDGVLSSTDIEEIQVFCDQYGVTYDSSSTDREYWAEKVDEVFTSGVSLASWSFVNAWYDLMSINYLVLAVGGIYILYVLGSISFGMVRRLLLLLVLFIISPIVCSLYPHDEGAAVKSWRGKFVQQVLSAYSAVAGMNLFFALTPLMQNIDIGNWGIDNFMGGLLNLILLIAGLYVVKEVIDLINGFVGGDNAYGTGNTLLKNTSIRLRSVQGRANKMTKATAGAFAKAAATKKAGGSFFKSMGGSIAGGIMGKKDEKGNRTGGLLNTINNKLFGVDLQAATNEARDQWRDDKNKAEGKRQDAIRRLKGITYDENTKTYEGNDYDDKGKQKFSKNVNGKREADRRTYTAKEVAELVETSGLKDEAGKSAFKNLSLPFKSYAEYEEALKNDQELAKGVDSARSKYEQANAKRNAMLDQKTLKVQGLDVANMSADQFNTLQDKMKKGQMYSGDDISVEAISARGNAEFLQENGSLPPAAEEDIRRKAEELVARRTAENRAISEFQQANQNAEAAAEAYAEAAQKAKDEQKTGAIKIEDSDIQAIRDGMAQALEKNEAVTNVAIENQSDLIKSLKESVDSEIVKTIKTKTNELIAEVRKGNERKAVNK